MVKFKRFFVKLRSQIPTKKLHVLLTVEIRDFDLERDSCVQVFDEVNPTLWLEACPKTSSCGDQKVCKVVQSTQQPVFQCPILVFQLKKDDFGHLHFWNPQKIARFHSTIPEFHQKKRPVVKLPAKPPDFFFHFVSLKLCTMTSFVFKMCFISTDWVFWINQSTTPNTYLGSKLPQLSVTFHIMNHEICIMFLYVPWLVSREWENKAIQSIHDWWKFIPPIP